MNFWEDKRVAVTGGSGLIGTPMIRKLESLGAKVRNVDLPKYDITNMQAMTDALVCDICIHLAAISNVEESRSCGLNTWEINVRGTWIVLEACLKKEVGAVVVASSNHVYGLQNDFPVRETAPLNQLDTYSTSKICIDYITRAYAHNYGLNTAVIRNTNCYGPEDPHSSHIIPGTILSLLDGRTPTIKTDGQIKKGYLYVDDVVDAYLLVAEKLYGTGYVRSGEVFNAGASPISALTLVQLITGLYDSGGAPPIVLGQASDQHDEQMDSTKLMALGWEPQYSLSEGLEKTIAWFKLNAMVGVC
jgi:CDP-glucose 4,6-dehydratase